MNDNDRGPGHGVAQGLFYGFIFLIFSFCSVYIALGVLLINHLRVAYQELVIEDWKSKPKTGDFWYDCIFRPLQTDATLLGFGYLPKEVWPLVVLVVFVLGFKKKNEWPLLLFWK